MKQFFNKFKTIGIGGNARSGKDSLRKILINLAQNEGHETLGLALAFELKKEMYSFVMEHTGIDVFTEVTEEKNLIRPVLVTYGGLQRKRSKGKYWTNKLNEHFIKSPHSIKIISDIRYFNEYPEDEFFWLKNKGGVTIFLERILPHGSIVPPANEDESKNNVLIKEAADITICWPTTSDMSVLKNIVVESLQEYADRRTIN